MRTATGRLQNQVALKQIIEEWFATLTDDDTIERILADELRLPAARLLSVGEFARDPVLSDGCWQGNRSTTARCCSSSHRISSPKRRRKFPAGRCARRAY